MKLGAGIVSINNNCCDSCRETHVLTHPTSGHFGGSSNMAMKSVLEGRKTVSPFPYPSCGPASWEHGGEEGGA